LADIVINPLITKKIQELDESKEFKQLLINLLEFEKLRTTLGEKEYTKEYDRRVSEYVTKHGE